MKTNLRNILIVDDDPKLGDLLVRYLDKQKMTTMVVQDGVQIDTVLAKENFDFVILDIMLPGEDGLSIARRLRNHSSIPSIMLSARGEDIEKIIGLEVGTDDYLAKPFNLRELLARIRAVLRRPVENTKVDVEKQNYKVYSFGPFQLNLSNHSLIKDNQSIKLTSGEYELMEAFVIHSDQVLSLDQLIDLLY